MNDENKWVVVAEKTKPHWLELVEYFDGRVYHRASAKWDGCIHFTTWGNDGETESDHGSYIHICEIDDIIDRLQRLKVAAAEHFKDHHYYEQSGYKPK